jgi:hypothetical protein
MNGKVHGHQQTEFSRFIQRHSNLFTTYKEKDI